MSDITALGSLTALTSLSLEHTQVTDISVLGSLTTLTTLSLTYTRTSDITPLSGCRSLHRLWLESTNLVDITPLLDIPRFGAGEGRALRFSDTPAADRDRDRRLHMLSRLDPEQCAIQTVQYLQGTHPDFRDPPGGAAPRPLAQLLAAATPVGFDATDGTLHVTNPGSPARLAPQEKATRLAALRDLANLLADEAPTQQLSRWLVKRFVAYATPLAKADPTYLSLDGPMAGLRSSCEDPAILRDIDRGFAAMWQKLVTMHDELAPFLLPVPEDRADLPPLTDDATAQTGEALLDDVREAFDTEGQGIVAPDVASTLDAIRNYFEAARHDLSRKSGLLHRGYVALGGMVAVLVTGTTIAANATNLLQWLATPQAQAILGRLQPILDAIVKLFGG